ncbi:PAS domain S-box-containing protein [Maledivibacter halophilus]|uniref:PAS domain S-box-containing protein n=2 Tax=Maledivibacter halophilus TaxID=36842 RepID=A0A1T5JBD4_9FIRM|nr:PAS domain S-box-containing protein [Maledivibacter halophilus]
MLFLNSTIEMILDNVNDAVCIVDKNCITRIWNKRAEEIHGVTKDKVLGRPITDFFPTALLPKVIREKRPYVDVYNSPKEDSHNIITARPLYSGNELIGGISCDRDISELIKLTALLDKTKLGLKVLEEEITALSENRFSFDRIVGHNIAFREIVNLCKNISKSNINIIITGESGTGKEVFARAIHIESRRKGHFIPINCSAIPEELMESELFGYEGGAFTGALRKGKVGKFELAHEGTLFLDEIGDMPLSMQPKILRVLEDGMITKVGGTKSVKVDVRVVAATNKDLKKMMKDGLFRKDLYYRLNSILIKLPPLRERKEDIPDLINEFIEHFCITYRSNIPEIPSQVMDALVNYEWEGNIRELKNIIERIVILVKNNKSEKIDIDFLPRSIIESNKERIKCEEEILDLNHIIHRAEKEAIINAMKISKGNKAKAAKLLNIPRSTLYFKLDKHKLTCCAGK